MKVYHNQNAAELHGPQYLGFENQRRLTVALDALQNDNDDISIEESDAVEWEDLKIAHTDDYLNELREKAHFAGMHEPVIFGEEAFLYPGTPKAVLTAVGSAVMGLNEILSGQERYAMSISRPPGHHAEQGQARGYCFASVAAITALRALRCGLKVAVFDFDLHQGNGTEQALRNTMGILFSDIYLEGEGEYPWVTRPVDQPYIPPAAASNIIKVALPPMTSGQTYLRKFHEDVYPQLKAFLPDLLICSAGFDCMKDDPVSKRGPDMNDPGGFSLTPEDIFEMTSKLVQINTPILSILEGGYDPIILSKGILAHLKAMK